MCGSEEEEREGGGGDEKNGEKGGMRMGRKWHEEKGKGRVRRERGRHGEKEIRGGGM